MSNISNRFFVTALEDGTTLHGNLVADKPLEQAWNGTNALPDWSESAFQPTIHLTLLSGATSVQPDMSSYKWLYNGDEITFGQDGYSTGDYAGLFQKTTTGGGSPMPALKIIDNLAGFSGNVDMDTITFMGTYDANGAGIDFSATAQVRITKIQKGGYLGVIEFANGISDFTEDEQTISMTARLYGGDEGRELTWNNNPALSDFTLNWYLNDSSVHPSPANPYSITDSDVVDYATVRCEFVVNSAVVYTSYVGIDDMHDPEFMYIQLDGANGNAASLRSGRSADFTIWVGSHDNPAVRKIGENAEYPYIYVKLLDSEGDVIGGSYSDIPDVVPNSGGFRPLTMSDGKGDISIPYAFVNANGKSITGIVVAYTTQPTWPNNG